MSLPTRGCPDRHHRTHTRRDRTVAASDPARPAPNRAGDVDEWVTVLEFGRPEAEARFLVEEVESLVDLLSDWQPSGLWHPDRYAIQVIIPARAPEEALYWACRYHHEAAEAAGVAGATLVRAEVLTVEELERSWEYDPAEAPDSRRPAAAKPQWLLCRELYEATQQLVAARTPAEVAGCVTRFVTAVDGQVEAGVAQHLPGMIDVDITVDGSQMCHASAEALSVSGLMLEQSLPALLADAQRVVIRLRGSSPVA